MNLDLQVSVNHNPLNPKFLKETWFPGIHPVTENTEDSSPVLKDVIINKSRHRALGDSKRTWRDGKTTLVAHPCEVSRNPRSFKARKYVNVTIAFLVYLQGGVHPAVAHNIQTDGTVGATFHIEPDHNPHAGEPATAWFALTTSGGEPLPLSQCDCRLAVYDRAVNPSVPILTPPLKAIAAEQYRDIPGAEVIFPQAGIYELEISGSPKSDADFEAFSLTYSVTVRPGKAPETPPVSVPSTPITPTVDDSIGKWHWMAIGLGGFIAALTLWVLRRKASQ